VTDSPQRTRVRRVLDGLKPYLEAFVGTVSPPQPRRGTADTAALLKELITRWESRFSRELPPVARSYVHELLDVRNRWAHEQPFTVADADRAVDTARQLARLIGAPDPTAAANLPSPRSASPRAVPASTKRPGQRETMRTIWSSVGGDEGRAIADYAAAERFGLVLRKTNKSGYSPEDYAKALISDGLRKGWLKQ